MRVALAHPYAWPTVRRGGERYLDDLAGWLRSRGHDVVVVTGEERPLHRRLSRRTGYRLTEVDTFGVSAWAPLLRTRVDVVHALVPSAAVAARLAGHRAVYSVLGLPSPASFGHRPGDRALFRAAVRGSAVAAALSPAAADGVRAVAGRDPVVLPPGTRLERFPLDDRPRTGPPRLLFSSDASDARKGLPLLLAALDPVLAARPDTRLALVGPGDPAAALSAASAAVRAAVDVHDVGDPADLPGHYRASTVTVLPSRAEAFGLVLVESLASGTPVVALDEGGPADIVASDVGRLAARAEPPALADALLAAVELAARTGTPQRCAEEARRWGWDVVGPQHEAVYAAALRGPRLRRG